MVWPPEVGETLPRAAEAWCIEGKWAAWILAGRTGTVTTAWHYAKKGAAPRLVTAYPRPYNRGHGGNA
jgi:hypothetical protein